MVLAVALLAEAPWHSQMEGQHPEVMRKEMMVSMLLSASQLCGSLVLRWKLLGQSVQITEEDTVIVFARRVMASVKSAFNELHFDLTARHRISLTARVAS
jgi:hypothetical protein